MATITTINAGDLITNSRAVINNNFAALNTDKIETSYLDTDTTLAANSDAKVPSQKAVKAYVDAQILVDPLVDIPSPVVRTYVNSGSPHTWTKPAGLRYVVVKAQAAGGGGAGYDTDGAAGPATSGASGGYCEKVILAASLGTTETVTVGAAGSGGTSASTATDGTNGGNASFGSHVTAGGGTKGTANSGTPPAGGTATGGDLNIPGTFGTLLNASPAKGGDSFLGKGSLRYNSGASTVDAVGYGGGGAGGWDNPDGISNGMSGGPGIVIVTEYYV